MRDQPRTVVPAAPADEGRHQSDADPRWSESWFFDFATAGAELGGYLRLGLHPGRRRASFWGCLVGEGRSLVTVLDHDLPHPAPGRLDVRGEGLWCDLVCETPLEHWTVGVEAFGVALDDPLDVERGCRGERTALGFDLEWESVAGSCAHHAQDLYEVPCRVHGEVLVGDETIDFDGWGERRHSWGSHDGSRYVWMSSAGRLEDGTMWHASDRGLAGADSHRGFVLPGGAGALEPVVRFDADHELDGQGLPTGAQLVIGDLDIAVEVLHHAPVPLEPPDGRGGRLARALSRYRTAGGRSGAGWMEWNQPPVPAPGSA